MANLIRSDKHSHCRHNKIVNIKWIYSNYHLKSQLITIRHPNLLIAIHNFITNTSMDSGGLKGITNVIININCLQISRLKSYFVTNFKNHIQYYIRNEFLILKIYFHIHLCILYSIVMLGVNKLFGQRVRFSTVIVSHWLHLKWTSICIHSKNICNY